MQLFTGFSQFVPFEGGMSDLLPWNGYAGGLITGIEDGDTSAAGAQNIKFTVTVNSQGAEGKVLRKWQPITGMRKDNKPNAIGLGSIILSAYSAAGGEAGEQQALQYVRGLEAQNVDRDLQSTIQFLRQQLMNRQVWVEVKAQRSVDDKSGLEYWSSDMANFVSRRKHDDAVGTNTARRSLPDEAQAFLKNGPKTVSQPQAAQPQAFVPGAFGFQQPPAGVPQGAPGGFFGGQPGQFGGPQAPQGYTQAAPQYPQGQPGVYGQPAPAQASYGQPPGYPQQAPQQAPQAIAATGQAPQGAFGMPQPPPPPQGQPIPQSYQQAPQAAPNGQQGQPQGAPPNPLAAARSLLA